MRWEKPKSKITIPVWDKSPITPFTQPCKDPVEVTIKLVIDRVEDIDPIEVLKEAIRRIQDRLINVHIEWQDGRTLDDGTTVGIGHIVSITPRGVRTVRFVIEEPPEGKYLEPVRITFEL